jgi:hypothetical protein
MSVLEYIEGKLESDTDDCIEYLFEQRSFWWKGAVRSLPWIVCEAGNGTPDDHVMVPIRSCDTVRCLNKKHYRWGTKAESKFYQKYAGAKGGADHPNAKLSWEAVSDIRSAGLEAGKYMYKALNDNGEMVDRYAFGVSREVAARRMAMAEKYGVTVQTIYRVLMGHIWKEEDRPESQGDAF